MKYSNFRMTEKKTFRFKDGDTRNLQHGTVDITTGIFRKKTETVEVVRCGYLWFFVGSREVIKRHKFYQLDGVEQKDHI